VKASSAIFVTGGTGFLGRRLVTALAGLGRPVYVLERAQRRPGAPAWPVGVTAACGDLLDPASYAAVLEGCDTVLHLAAATGKAPAAEHERVNRRGTEALLAACRAAGVARVLFVSSIAAAFDDVRGYHYAIAKQQAEAAVRASGLRFLILRPTMILGPGSPLLTSLEKLALLPIALLPGHGRARVQPVYVDDVAAAMVEAIRTDAFDGETIALGGPEALSIEALLRRVRQARRGTAGPLVRVPLPLLQVPLAIAERLGLGAALPITAGQLSSFKYDGLGAPNRLQLAERTPEADVATMIAGADPAAHRAADLEGECDVLTRYLIGRAPTEMVVQRYVDAHEAVPVLTPSAGFDGWLVRFARRDGLRAWIADAYSAVVLPASTLRRKLVLLLAVLETSASTHEAIDAPLAAGAAGAPPPPAAISARAF
jgi:NADH dehydrogenase